MLGQFPAIRQHAGFGIDQRRLEQFRRQRRIATHEHGIVACAAEDRAGESDKDRLHGGLRPDRDLNGRFDRTRIFRKRLVLVLRGHIRELAELPDLDDELSPRIDDTDTNRRRIRSARFPNGGRNKCVRLHVDCSKMTRSLEKALKPALP